MPIHCEYYDQIFLWKHRCTRNETVATIVLRFWFTNASLNAALVYVVWCHHSSSLYMVWCHLGQMPFMDVVHLIMPHLFIDVFFNQPGFGLCGLMPLGKVSTNHRTAHCARPPEGFWDGNDIPIPGHRSLRCTASLVLTHSRPTSMVIGCYLGVEVSVVSCHLFQSYTSVSVVWCHFGKVAVYCFCTLTVFIWRSWVDELQSVDSPLWLRGEGRGYSIIIEPT